MMLILLIKNKNYFASSRVDRRRNTSLSSNFNIVRDLKYWSDRRFLTNRYGADVRGYARHASTNAIWRLNWDLFNQRLEQFWASFVFGVTSPTPGS
ncbi:unnamed protein product [Parnassius apollo]|uniref:(apollo) hypothetical protein n=1 Tax=Parnassius apollo TaxID=110799 RepID=A0A8S3WIF1_PARAO|nr:unnamed protein product [Parnassius apollo]